MKPSRLVEAEYLRRLLQEKDLATYSRAAWKVIEPSTPLRWSWHLDAICEHLEAVKLGQIKRLIINIPPRNLKSILTTVSFPSWWWATDPYARFICTSYSHSLSAKHSIARRALIEHPWYRKNWGDKVILADDQNTKAEFENTVKGHMIATSMQGAATGKGATCIIVDDPHDTTRAGSQTMRESDIEAFDQKFTTRLDDKETGRIVIIMQRLHDRDLTGHLLKKGGYEHLCLPAICEEPQTIVFPISKKTIHRNTGDVLHPKREPIQVLEKQKLEMGSWPFVSQYQQRPTALEGGLIKREWIKHYKAVDLAKCASFLMSWDLSVKGTNNSDFVCGQVWAKGIGGYYLLDQFRARIGFTEQIAAIKSMVGKWPQARLKLIEEMANGMAAIETLRSKVPGLVGVRPDRSKESRLNAVAPAFESGNIFIPDPSIAPWVHDYIEELVGFPNMANDDQVDATTQALDRLLASGQYDLKKMVQL